MSFHKICRQFQDLQQSKTDESSNMKKTTSSGTYQEKDQCNSIGLEKQIFNDSSIQSNRLNAIQRMLNGSYGLFAKPVQLATKDLTLSGKTSTVATSMSVVLDPKNAPKYGESSSEDKDLDNVMSVLPTDTHFTGNKKFVKGHLLNDNLGGKANKDNLYPITGQANSDHKNKVETPIKKYMDDGVGDSITYTVNVTDAIVKKEMNFYQRGPYSTIDTPKATFTCKTTGGTGFTNIDEKIPSEAESRS